MATVSDDVIKAYVEQNRGDPQAIAAAAGAAGVSKVDLMRATGYSSNEIDTYFNAANVKTQPVAATAEQRAAVATQLGLDQTVAQMRTARIPDEEINAYLDRAAIEVAQGQVDTTNANRQFASAQAELDALMAQETAEIRRQQAEFESAQQRLAAQAAEQAAAARAEQERLAAEAAAYQKQAEEKAAQIKAESETFQRTTAERDVARKRAGRSTIARPLLSGAAVGAAAPTLGVGGGMSSTGSLGTTGTLGVG